MRCAAHASLRAAQNPRDRHRAARILPYSAAGTLIWATTFTLVGYAFALTRSETAGELVTRIVMVAALAIGAGLAATDGAAQAASGSQGIRARADRMTP